MLEILLIIGSIYVLGQLVKGFVWTAYKIDSKLNENKPAWFEELLITKESSAKTEARKYSKQSKSKISNPCDNAEEFPSLKVSGSRESEMSLRHKRIQHIKNIHPEYFSEQSSRTNASEFDENLYLSSLQSDRWQSLRKCVFYRDANTCQMCNKVFEQSELEAHHLHYTTLGSENLSDIETVCVDCHELVHKIHGKNASYYPLVKIGKADTCL